MIIHKPWTYNADAVVASLATRLFDARPKPCRVSPLILMSDARLPDIEGAAARLPGRSTLIYRHFGDTGAPPLAARLARICTDRGLQFLIGQDVELAAKCGADGVHLPQRDMSRAKALRAQFPDWIITAAVHDGAAIKAAQDQPLDAIILSPVFESLSPSAKRPLGVKQFKNMASQSTIPVFALGGINANTCETLIGTGAYGVAGVSGILE